MGCSPGMTAIVKTVDSTFNPVDLHRLNPHRYPHLLKSTAQGRYDILFAFPGASLVLDADGNLTVPETVTPCGNDFLKTFDGWWKQNQFASPGDKTLPFSGGWFVYLGYELVAQIEPCLQLPAADSLLPTAIATRFATAVIVDHETGITRIAGEAGESEAVQAIAADINSLPVAADSPATRLKVTSVNEAEPQQYLDAVARIHEYIQEGDVFQVNLSRQWDIRLQQAVDTDMLFDHLGVHNPSPFSGLASWHDTAIISSSPERLVSVRDGLVETRPIAGTRPRSDSHQADTAYSEELLAHPKERAEHIMLIDLERNDLGRLCVPGTIEVNELMVLESYAHVHHIVSNVRGRLRDNISPGEVIRAVFPGGTITGCPKVRCMEIIAELEQQARGAYTGSMGYINGEGSMDLNILIRSIVSSGKQLQFRAGAGIVADSDAGAELDETRAKAKGLLRAVGLEDT
ncbi:MAG: aminodeoxychorismate synthase component I [Gammaproteobacteria bacterium]|nr:aminodeoxychorismate synthase component I [Gammaproteobacteria bacterium]